MDIEAAVQSLVDRAEVIDVLTRYATSIDRRRWDDFAACLADTVEISMPVTGGSVAMSRDELVGLAGRIYAQLAATQHISANHQVTIAGDDATAVSTLNATHYLGADVTGGSLQREIGYYEWRLIRSGGWRIDRMHMTITWVEGNTARFREIQATAEMPTADEE
ncbi:nuclear transport factor 2 family protein [Mycolicibacterium sp.]|uniref:nuclear transport factor 2 family protein n=1 Tax=Mycolicibacterium sp. TaxID=2320850 RepID=UPI003D0E5BA2